MFGFTPHSSFHLGPLAITSHGLFFILGALFARALARRRLDGKERRLLDESVGVMVLAAGVGARVTYLICHPFMWSQPSQWWKFWQGGMVSYGGLAGAIVALVLFRRRKRLAHLPLLDLLSPALLAGWGVGRLGCFLTWYGEEGKPTHLPWGIKVDGTSHHPVQIYLVLLLWTGSLVLSRRDCPRPGERTALSLLWYAMARGFSDLFRVYEPAYLETLSQLTCLAIATTAAAWYTRIRSRKDSECKMWKLDPETSQQRERNDDGI